MNQLHFEALIGGALSEIIFAIANLPKSFQSFIGPLRLRKLNHCLPLGPLHRAK